jgi:hypothetical protein
MVEEAARDLGLSGAPGELFVREKNESEREARPGFLRRLWRRRASTRQPEL